MKFVNFLVLAIPNLCREVLGLVINIFLKTHQEKLLNPLLLALNFFSLHQQSLIHLACNKDLVNAIKDFQEHRDEQLRSFSRNICANLDFERGKIIHFLI